MESFIIGIYKKFLYGIITRDEFLEMKYSLNKSEDKEIAELLKEEWDENISTEKLDSQAKKEIRSSLNFYLENEQKQVKRRWLLPIAAAIIPLLIVSISLLFISTPAKKGPTNFIVAVERGNKALVTLPDQSKVWLNSNSMVKYTKGKDNVRNIKLSGEAFFKVTKDKVHPFVVTMNNLHIEVIGTSFNAKSREGSDIIETSLVEGNIRLYSPDLSQDYFLQPNEKAIYNQSAKKIQILHTDNELETAWRDNKLKFSSETFINIMSMFEDWYGVKIICKCPEIENDLISGTFNDVNLETSLEALKMQYNIDYIRSRDTIIVMSNNK